MTAGVAVHGPGGSSVDGVDRDVWVRWLLDVAPGYRWGGRQGIDLVRPGLEARVLVGAYERAVTHPGERILVECHDGAPAAATIRRDKPMETESFGVRTAALTQVVSPPELPERPEVVRRLLQRACREAVEEGVGLLILRVEADDVQTLAVAQDVGFRVCESTTTWLVDAAAGPAPTDLPGGVTVEVHEGDVAGVLTDDEVERLASTTARWQLNHFRADPRLGDEAVDRFYEQWVHNIASGRWSDCIFVARREGRLVGLASELTDRELYDLTGTAVRVMEWLVTVERGQGNGRHILAAAANHSFPGGTWHWWETQARNTPTIRRIEQTGVAVPVRSCYTLHAWPTGG